jgi:L-amino acid N-acyltransferase YncA
LSDYEIREARLEDIPGLLAIYNKVIAHSTAIYFDDPISLENRIAWFHQREKEGYPIFVAVNESGVIGFSSFGDFRPFPGYRFTVEHSIHVRHDQRGKGLGPKLMAPLLERARALGKHVMLGVIDGDNAKSIAFHQRLGFEQVAFLPEVGFKFGRWLDLVIMERKL